MLSIIITFVVASVILELLVVQHMPLVRQLAQRYRLFSIVLSVGLSWALGHLFAATGMIVMVSAIVSSAVTQPLYAVLHRCAGLAGQVKQPYARFKAGTKQLSTSASSGFLFVRRFFMDLYEFLAERRKP